METVASTGPVRMLCTYHPKRGKEKDLLSLVKNNWTTLKRAGLVTTDRAVVYRATDKKSGRVYFVESFSWKDGEASDAAHRTPEVMAVWDAMGPLLEGMELAVIEPISDKR
jgi:quinol monooxygenase YgiN